MYYFIKSRLEKGCKDFLTVILYNDNAVKAIDREQLSCTNDVQSLIQRLMSYVVSLIIKTYNYIALQL